MADRGDTHYHVPHLNRWFAVSSLLLLISAVWMVIDDWSRPWKGYQREFRDIEIERARAALESAEAQEALAAEEAGKQELEAAERALAANQAELDAAQETLRQLRGEQFIATEAEKKAKQVYNWERWSVEEHRIHTHDQSYGVEYLRGFEDTLLAKAGDKQRADAAVAAQEAVVAGLTADITEAEQAVKDATKSIELVRKKLDTIAPADAPTKIANVIRDFPGLDFIGPSLKVDKVVLDDLTFELNFTKKKRIDMCMTCHMPIDRAGYENEAQPFRSHPRLDLFLTAKSPHPMSRMGCTICHRGSGEALDFQRADHRASTFEEGETWHEEYGWHKQHYWDYPMLTSDFVEASCVQCHKDSMELIAPEAPKVAEGYRLFEEYACYSCHKVEWFPTKRRPGPSLKHLQAKTTKDFAASWIANPKAFRPTTRMPRIFHLENYAPEEVIAVSSYGEGPPVLGQAWNDTAVAAVTEFIWRSTQDFELPGIPVEGDPVRGLEVFRVSGCLACHNVAPNEEPEEPSLDPAQHRRGANEHGPNLRGIATKTSPEWLYAWIKDPAAYWPGTKMPDLRLSDQEAADVVAYVFDDPAGYFHEVPDGWQPAPAPYDRLALEEQARWFFNRTARDELERRFREDWKDDGDLLAAVGEKYLLNQGCHSCHEIAGLENAMPIGTELTNWGSKTVDKLDWGFMHEIIAEEKGWSGEDEERLKEQLVSYREPWLMQKLHEPRSFDRRKVKNPTEKLRMPWFEFTDEQVRAIATFVVGLVDDEVQRAKMIPTPAKAEMDAGLRVVRQKNCEGCHVIEPGSIAFDDEDGVRRVAHGQFINFEGRVLPPPMTGFRDYVAEYEAGVREDEEDPEYELEDVAFQLIGPHPELGRSSGSTIVIENVDSIETTPAWGGGMVEVVTDYYLNWSYDQNTGDPDGEGRIQDVDGEWRRYDEEPYEKVRWTFAPPVLLDEGAKLQREWFQAFLLDPTPLRPQMRVRMPTFRWDEGEAGAVAGYFAQAAAAKWPSILAKGVLLDLESDPAGIADDVAALGLPSVSASQVEGICRGDPVDTQAALDRLIAYAVAKGLDVPVRPDPEFAAIPQRMPSRLDALLAAQPDFFDRVYRLALEGPNCFQCHFLHGTAPTAEGPIAWAPDLYRVRNRLRVGWTREWLHDPSRKYPGTAMPANFPPDQSVYQDLYPGTSTEQIEAVLTWLFNLDRAVVGN